jgi:flagellar hook protein FlgE
MAHSAVQTVESGGIMGLSAVMHTALSGLGAATTQIEVAADNLANVQTRGFKAARVRFGTLSPQTLTLAGGNPLQIGRGVRVIAIDRDQSQGPIVVADDPPLLALEGEGLFILEGPAKERYFARDGQFRLNAAGELTTAAGDRVLGFGIDSEGQIDRGQLSPLRIRIGSTVAGAGGTPVTLRSYSISRNGKIVGQYSDGVNRTLGQVRLARFANPQGLAARPGNRLQGTAASGLPQEFDPGEAGTAETVSGASELSNVDISRELIELTLAGNLFQANLAVLATADSLLGELFFPWRR